MPTPDASLPRRRFLQTLAAASAINLLPTAMPAAESTPAITPRKLKLGFDNFSIRGFRWKAPRQIEYAATLKIDVLFISDLDSYETLEDGYLRDQAKKAHDLGLEIYAGGWSICPTSKNFRNKWGTAEEHLALGIRVAQAVGSPVFRCLLGKADDRKTEGGIDARIEDTVKVLKSQRSRAMDAGVKIAIENHAGDMQAWELVRLIEEAGPEYVGATMDSGNTTWTLEDPRQALELLGPHALVCGLRDSMIWENADGAVVQWTAPGDGLIDWQDYAKRFGELCPNTPFTVEIISGFARPFPYLHPDFWQPYPKARAADFAAFLALAKRGHAIEPFKAPAGSEPVVADQEYQKGQLERAITYLRDKIGLGLKA
ncbi:MAG: sugar phosphate isomerase/epimerase [Chthoniobacter sp.]|uniref:sugar phosphate isomerase/epimerase family protein n=1 Tax=Chthoniobacter sp. TaxID=2510640 RepID=UPI0032A50C5C